MGSQVVPIAEPDWDCHKEKEKWQETHFINCIIEGLKKAQTKTLNYAKLADIEQGEKENPGRFLERLREALWKFTNISPESAEGETILKDKFFSQSAPDIYHKLEKQAFRQHQSLEKLFQLTQIVYYSREYEEENKRQIRTRQKTEAPTMAVRPALKKPEEKCLEEPMWKGMDLLLLWKKVASQARLPSGI